jgi:hypothetical protein
MRSFLVLLFGLGRAHWLLASAEVTVEQPLCTGRFNPLVAGERPVPQPSPVIEQFMAKILKEREGSFWNHYYGEECIWVSERSHTGWS